MQKAEILLVLSMIFCCYRLYSSCFQFFGRSAVEWVSIHCFGEISD
jgi:hypothetical protein